MLSLKRKIKDWERLFFTVHGRKPTSHDIKMSQQEIRVAYSNYWKAKKSESDSSVKMNQLLNDVWSKDLNTKQEASSKSHGASNGACIYGERIKNKVLPSFNFKGSHQQGTGSSANQQNVDYSADQSFVLQTEAHDPSCNSNLLHTPRVHHNKQNGSSISTSYITEELQRKDTLQDRPEGLPRPLSPVGTCSIQKTLYFKNSLDESWLSRNSQADGDDDVFCSPSSTSACILPGASAQMCSLRDQSYLTSKIKFSSDSRSTADSTLSDVFYPSLSKSDSPTLELKSSIPPSPTQSRDCLDSLHNPSHKQQLSPVANDANSLQKQETYLAHNASEQEHSRKYTSSNGDVAAAGRSIINHSKIPLSIDVVDEASLPTDQATANYEKTALKTSCERESGVAAEKHVEYSEVPEQREMTSRKRKQPQTTKPTRKGKRVKLSIKNVPVLDDGNVDHQLQKPSSQGSRKPKKNSLERKVETGTLNENYVRINLKKKKFSRGHHKLNVRRSKYQQWKEKRKAASGEVKTLKTSACFKCGEVGHWARACHQAKYQGLSGDSDTEVPALPTLEEAAEMACGAKAEGFQPTSRVFNKIETNMPGNLLGPVRDIEPNSSIPLLPLGPDCEDTPVVQPFIPTGSGGLVQDTPEIVHQTLHKFGFSEFRPGQEEAIMRILSGLSTLVVSSTGSGKSLCYQLPAYLYAQKYECITLVISPLISLMEDQVVGLAPCLKAAFLHSAMSAAQREQVVERIKARELHFVLVSPEMLMHSSTGGLLNYLPKVAFACIDEAHCLSQWSHNFRPSYLQLYKILKARLNIHCILALTATATQSTCLNIVECLGIENASQGIIGCPHVPDNLVLSVSREESRDEALIGLLKGSRFNTCESIIIYCTRREETERLAALIRTSLQQEERMVGNLEDSNQKQSKKNRPKNKFAWDAEAYHAGMTSYKRHSIQKKFMTGMVRIVVATVAFGMGIDKADIRAIIHYNMPKSFEGYVQEAGRAGRDGLTSHCHLFLEPQGKDQNELKRHIYANSTDRHVLRKLLRRIFGPLNKRLQDADKKASPMPMLTNAYEVAVPIDATVEELDLKEENIQTLMCFLEFHPKKVLEVLNKVYSTCTIKCYGGPKQLRSIASKSAAVAAAMALSRERGLEQDDTSSVKFQVVDVAAYMGWDSGLVKRELKRLEWDNSTLQSSGHSRKTGVLAEFSELAFHLKVSTNVTEGDQDDLLNYLHSRVQNQERTELLRLRQMHSCFESVAYESYLECIDSASFERSDKMKQVIRDYFSEKLKMDECHEEDCLEEEGEISSLQREICALVNIHKDHKFNGRAIARIFHGIGSPCFPAEVWGRVRRFWRSHLHFDFNTILKVANQELMHL